MNDINTKVCGCCEHLPYYKVVDDPDKKCIQTYLDDLEYFLDLIEENLDFKIKDVLNRRQIKRKHGITVESEQEKAALAMYKVACKLAKDWESFWVRRV